MAQTGLAMAMIAKIDALREQRVKIESDIRKKAALLPYAEPEPDQPTDS